MRTQGIDTAVMEVSSHGLDLGRVDGCRFAVAAFTNLTQDHLDYHGDMDRYREAKVSLMKNHLAAEGAAVVNVDDPSGGEFAAAARERGARVIRRVARCARRRRGAPARGRGRRRRLARAGRAARWRRARAWTLPLLGDFNLENLLVAAGIGSALGVSPDAIAAGVASCRQVPGRIERVGDARRPARDRRLRPHARTRSRSCSRRCGRCAAGASSPCSAAAATAIARKRPLMARGRGALRRPRRAHERQSAHRGSRERSSTTSSAASPGSRASRPRRSTRRAGYARIADRRAAIAAALAIARPRTPW